MFAKALTRTSSYLNSNHPDKGGVSRERFVLGALILVGIAMRAAAIIAYSHAPESDEVAYLGMAENLASGRGFVDGVGNHAFFNWGYPLFVIAPVLATIGQHLWVVKLLNLFLSTIAIPLCYFTAQEAGAGRAGRLIAAAMWTIYLPASVYTVYLAKENLMVPLMLGVTWCALRLLNRPDWRVSVLCGGLLGILALTGNAALSLCGAVAIAFLLGGRSLLRTTAYAGLIFLAVSVIVAPWLVRNFRVFGSPVLNTNGGFNLYLGNNPAATGWFISINDTPRGPTWTPMRKANEYKASEVLKHEAIDWIKTNPVAFLKLAMKKAFFFWAPPFHSGENTPSLAEFIVRCLWAIQFVLLQFLVVSSFLLPELRNRRIAVLWTAIGAYTAVHMLFYVVFRYREPIMPVVCVLAALAIDANLRKRALSSSAQSAR